MTRPIYKLWNGYTKKSSIKNFKNQKPINSIYQQQYCSKHIDEEKYLNAFYLFDYDGDGKISINDLFVTMCNLGETPSIDKISNIVKSTGKEFLYYFDGF